MNIRNSVEADHPQARLASGFRYSPVVLPGLARALDAGLVLLSGAASIAYVHRGAAEFDTEPYWFATVFIALFHLMLGERAELFTINAIMRPMRHADDLIVSLMTTFLIMLSVIYAFKSAEVFSRFWLALFCGGAIVAVTIGRLSICSILKRLAARKLIGRNVVLLGTGEQAQKFLRRYEDARPFFLEVTGVFSDGSEPSPQHFEGRRVIGDVGDLLNYARAREVDDVVIALPWSANENLKRTIERLKELPINVYLSTDLVGFDFTFEPVTGSFREVPMFEVIQRPISGWSSALKSLEDYVIAALLLLLLSPLLLLIAAAVKIDSKGPVFFMQERLGFNNKVFHIYKFRSMYHNRAPEIRVEQARKGDPRVTRVGRFIRATSLDELPQLLNVLDGTMSLVGPRPHAVSHNEEFGARIRGYFARHKVKPGITGWAQVNGLRGETDTVEKMEARIRHDVYYAENWSILFDIRILIMTGLVVFFQKTAY